MKKYLLVLGVIFVSFLSSCATTGDEYGADVAHLPKHFIYEKHSRPDYNTSPREHISYYIITGLKKGEFTTVIIPSEIRGIPVERVGSNSFKDKGLTEVILPDTLREIGRNSFENNLLTEVTLSGSIYLIQEFAFANNKLTEIIISEGITRIEKGAFANNLLTQVTFTGSVYLIDEFAFANNKLKSINLPEFLESTDPRYVINSKLSSSAFAENPLDKPIVLPESVKEILSESFTGVIEGIGKDRTITVINGKDNKGTITIPSTIYGIPVTKIGEGPRSVGGARNRFFAGQGPTGTGVSAIISANQNRRKLNTLVLPEHLKEIEFESFQYCDIANVVTPNEAVKQLWEIYYTAQKESDNARTFQERNRAIEQMRQQIDIWEKTTERLR